MGDCRLAEEWSSHFSSWGKSLVSWEHLQGDYSASVSKIKEFFSLPKQTLTQVSDISATRHYLDGFARFFLFLKLYEGKTLGVTRGLVSGDANINHVPTFCEHPLNPAVCHVLRQKFLKKERKVLFYGLYGSV